MYSSLDKTSSRGNMAHSFKTWDILNLTDSALWTVSAVTAWIIRCRTEHYRIRFLLYALIFVVNKGRIIVADVMENMYILLLCCAQTFLVMQIYLNYSYVSKWMKDFLLGTFTKTSSLEIRYVISSNWNMKGLSYRKQNNSLECLVFYCRRLSLSVKDLETIKDVTLENSSKT